MSVSGKVILAVLTTFSLYLAACSKGGPGEDASDKGTTSAGTANLAVDVCEKPENVNNILCQWVATEWTIHHAMGNQTADIKMLLKYDEQARLINLESYYNGDKFGIMNFLYIKEGVWKQISIGAPDPPGSENFTSEDTTITAYYTEGSIQSIQIEKKLKGALTGKTASAFSHQGNDTYVMTASTDAGGAVTSGIFEIIKKNPGKSTRHERFEVGPPSGGYPLTTWSIQDLEYDSETGRLKKMVQQRQDCTAVPCGTNNTYPVGAGVAIDPFILQTNILTYDERNRVLKAMITNDGDSNNTTGKPNGTVDSTSECEMKYEIQSQASIASDHPMVILAKLQNMEDLAFGFSRQDLFSSWGCKEKLGEVAFGFKWVRLWEAIPEGKPPGGS